MADSNKRLLSILAALQFVTLGLLLTLVFVPPAERPLAGAGYGAERDVVEPAAPVSARHEAIALAEFKAAMRSVLREELEAHAGALQAGAAPREAASPEAPSVNDLQAREEAGAVSAAVVQQALSAGVWTAGDTRALLPHLGRLSEEQRAELVDRFYTAVNRQQLDLEDVPPL